MTGEAVVGRKVCIPDKQTERGYHNYWGNQQREEAHIPPPDLFFVWCPSSQNNNPPATHVTGEKAGRGHLKYFPDTFSSPPYQISHQAVLVLHQKCFQTALIMVFTTSSGTLAISQQDSAVFFHHLPSLSPFSLTCWRYQTKNHSQSVVLFSLTGNANTSHWQSRLLRSQS